MDTRLKALAVIALLVSAAAASAGGSGCRTDPSGATVCPPPDSECLANRYGNIVCSPPRGGIVFNRNGEPVCGVGHCTIDLRGEVMCSTVPAGPAATSQHGNAVCHASCAPATAATCVIPKS